MKTLPVSPVETLATTVRPVAPAPVRNPGIVPPWLQGHGSNTGIVPPWLAGATRPTAFDATPADVVVTRAGFQHFG